MLWEGSILSSCKAVISVTEALLVGDLCSEFLIRNNNELQIVHESQKVAEAEALVEC